MYDLQTIVVGRGYMNLLRYLHRLENVPEPIASLASGVDKAPVS